MVRRHASQKSKYQLWNRLQIRLPECQRCPRLTHYCSEIAQKKVKRYKTWNYYAKPVPAFGDPDAKLWIIGLAPGAHGANRTGRVFTGDESGNWLYRVLHETGFANQAESTSLKDGLSLENVVISMAVRCAPPDNKPSLEEKKACFSHLKKEAEILLPQVKVILALGSIAFQTVLNLLKENGFQVPKPAPKFRHLGEWKIGPYWVMSSYHPSQQNTFTGKLKYDSWRDVFLTAKSHLPPAIS